MNKNIPELLSPAGSAESMRAAVAAGCDAVYLGGRSFNARDSAENFTDTQIEEAIDYCHLRGVKVYVTVNTVYTNGELPMLFEFMSKAYAYGADAFILQDIGVAAEARKLFPNIQLHASTQMTAVCLDDVLYLKSVGFDRVILGRELLLDEIKHIVKNSDVGIECFVHGALCVSFSGQCLMSGFIGRRSGNRGRCAQPCRRKYSLLNGGTVVDSGYLLSPKDLMTLEFLDELVAAGITGLKIEGRMKSPQYVAQVTKAYRERLDGAAADPLTLRKVTQVFNRGGFTDGYYKRHSSPEMISRETPKSIGTYLGRVMSYDGKRGICKIFLENSLLPGDGIEIWTKKEPHAGASVNKAADTAEVISVSVKGDISAGDKVYKSFDKQLMDECKKIYEKDVAKIAATASVRAVAGEPVYIKLSADGITVEKSGAVAEKSQNAPLSADKITGQLSKMGNTPFTVDFEDCEIGDNIFIGLSALNELRREAADELARGIVLKYKREAVTKPAFNASAKAKRAAAPMLTALVRNNEQFNGVIESKSAGRVYFEVSDAFITNLDKYVSKCTENDVELFAALPNVLSNEIELLERSGIDGYLARSYGAVAALDGTEKRIALDHSFNVINRLSHDFLQCGADGVCMSPEASLRDISETAGEKTEIIVYGKMPLMLTRQCPVGLFAAAKNGNKYCKLKNNSSGYCMKDEAGVRFPIITNCKSCVAYVYNDRPVFMLNKMADITSCNAALLRLSFTDETRGEAYGVCEAYADACRGLQTDTVKTLAARLEAEGFTYGYFFSGFGSNSGGMH